MAKTFKEMGEELIAKRKSLMQDWRAKPHEDFNRDEIDNMKQRAAELNDLQDAYEQRKELEAAISSNEDVLKKMEAGVQKVPFTSGDGRALTELQKKESARAAVQQDQELVEYKSLGEQWIESDGFLNYKPSVKRGPEVELGTKTIFATSVGSGGLTTGFPIQSIRTGVVVDYKLRQPVMDGIIPIARTTYPSVVYMEEQVPVNGATYLYEGQNLAGESAIQYVEKTSPVRKVRISIPVTDEMMADAAMMMDIVNTRLLELLALKKDQSLINGTGTAPEVTGILNTANILTQAKGGDPSPDAFLKALTKIAVQSFLEPDNILIHPTNWQDVRLLRTSEGLYIFGSPLDPAPSRMWGYPVTVTQGMPVGTAVCGAFRTATQQFTRQDVVMLASNEHATNFMDGLLTIKAEIRLALVVYRPAGICTVTGL